MHSSGLGNREIRLEPRGVYNFQSLDFRDYFLLLNRPHLLKVPLPPQIGPPQRNKCLEQGPGRETLSFHTIPHIVGLTNQGAGASSSAGLPRMHRKKFPILEDSAH